MGNYNQDMPDNFQQKCLVVLLLDVSGSMRKPISSGSDVQRIDRLNEAIAQFYDDIIYGKNGVQKTTVGQLEVAIVAFDQEPKLIRKPKLLSRDEPVPVLTERGSTTETVKALEFAINEVIQPRKLFYERTGQTYYRPWIVLLTDGNPSSPASEIEKIAPILEKKVADKHFTIMGVGIGDEVSMDKLNLLCANRGSLLKDMRFGKFFRWLSNSLTTITKSNEDDTVDISSGADEWMRRYTP